ncbi:signal peptidase I [Nocardioides kribbensis]|uniref:signal peptidase I n=1 Tax=Nocardioides kribbensis TaxID=305517 RepID=UPI0032D9D711
MRSRSRSRSRSRGTARGWAGQVAAWTVLLAVAAVVAAGVVVPRVVGATPYTVLTGSMAPTYPPGTLVVVRPVDADDVGPGTPVTFQLESGRPEVVTHRVVDVAYDLTGRRLLTTQGDANPVPDAEPVEAAQLRGEVWYAVPHLGRVNALLTGHQRQVAVWVVGGGLLAYAGAMFVGAARERGRRPRPTHLRTA